MEDNPLNSQQPSSEPTDGQMPASNPTPTPGTGVIDSTKANQDLVQSTFPKTVVMGSTDPTAPVMKDEPKGMKGHKMNLRFNKLFLIIILVIVVLVGGAAAAYEEIIVPNKPANVIRTAFVSSVQQQYITATGTFTSVNSSTKLSSKVGFTIEDIPASKSLDISVNFTINGLPFPAEIREVGGNVYFKLGDLSTLSTVLNAFSSKYGTLISSLSSQLSNKWFVVDSTLIQSTTAKCYSSAGITSADVTALNNDFKTNNFLDVTGSSSDSLSGVSVEKYQVSASYAKAEAFFNDLSNLPSVKAIDSCTKSSTPLLHTIVSKAGSGSTPITIWVNKSKKQVVQIVAPFSDATNHTSGQGTVDLSYNPITIVTPQGAEPITNLITTLESAFGASSGTTL